MAKDNKEKLEIRFDNSAPSRHYYFNRFFVKRSDEFSVVVVWLEAGFGVNTNNFSFLIQREDIEAIRGNIKSYLTELLPLVTATIPEETNSQMIPALDCVENYRAIICDRLGEKAEIRLGYYPLALHRDKGLQKLSTEVSLSSSLEVHVALLGTLLSEDK